MNYKYVAVIMFAMWGSGIGNPVASPEQKADPVYDPVASYQPPDNYVPHATYPYSDTYPNTGYDGYLIPAGPGVQYPPAGEYMTALMPTAQTALQIALRIFAKTGLFLIGGVALLIVGGIFTTAVCSLTPVCTITFAGLRNIDKDAMRSYVTPDSLTAAASFVQEAIGKYQRLQRAVGNK